MAPRTTQEKERVIILGAAGRDFHDFNVLFRDNSNAEVVAFTASQIPGIDRRKYPPELAGPLYPGGVQVYPEEELEELIVKFRAHTCILAYSDLSEADVMRLEARVLAKRTSFLLPNPWDTLLPSKKLVVAVTAVRTGAGKSQVAHFCSTVLAQHKLKVVLVRHPMPYGDLKQEKVQRFERYDDLRRHKVTIEEREEYEQHLKEGAIVYAGVDYQAILEEAEKEADVIIWDGGNNDTPLYKPDLWICVADPLRLGHELTYYPGNVNFKAADVVLINKANSASKEAVNLLKKRAVEHNPSAQVVVTSSVVAVDDVELVTGKRVVTVDDGPTLTHGGMPTGAGKVAAERYGAEVVDPRSHFRGSLRRALVKYPHIGKTIPAMGYSPEQIEDLAETIGAVEADTVLIATPMDLNRLLRIPKPSTMVRYRIAAREGEGDLQAILEHFVQARRLSS